LCAVLSIFGAGLIVLSVAALRNANLPVEGVEQALLKTLESTNMDKVWKVLAMPFDLLISAKDAVVWLVTLPFHLVSKSFRSLGRAGTAGATFVGSLIQWILQLPSQLLHSMMAALGTSWTAMSIKISETSQAALAPLSSSFLGVFFKNLGELFSNTIYGTRAVVASTRLVLSNGTEAADAYMKMALDIVAQAYARTLGSFATANRKMSTGASWLQASGSHAVQDVSNGYDYLNELAAALAFYIEDIMSAVTGTGGGSKAARRGPRR
jgi:hypothetical protein